MKEKNDEIDVLISPVKEFNKERFFQALNLIISEDDLETLTQKSFELKFYDEGGGEKENQKSCDICEGFNREAGRGEDDRIAD